MKYYDDNGPYNIWAEAETTVEFYECDPMGIVWHGNYLNYFEKGRRALLEKINYDYHEMRKSGYAFPVIDIAVKYPGALHFGDRIIIKAILTEYEYRLRIQYEIRNAETGQLCTKGISTQMAFDVKAADSCFVSPKILADRVEAFIKSQE